MGVLRAYTKFSGMMSTEPVIKNDLANVVRPIKFSTRFYWESHCFHSLECLGKWRFKVHATLNHDRLLNTTVTAVVNVAWQRYGGLFVIARWTFSWKRRYRGKQDTKEPFTHLKRFPHSLSRRRGITMTHSLSSIAQQGSLSFQSALWGGYTSIWYHHTTHLFRRHHREHRWYEGGIYARSMPGDRERLLGKLRSAVRQSKSVLCNFKTIYRRHLRL